MSLCEICECEPEAVCDVPVAAGWLHTKPALGAERLCVGCALSNPDAVCSCCGGAMWILNERHEIYAPFTTKGACRVPPPVDDRVHLRGLPRALVRPATTRTGRRDER